MALLAGTEGDSCTTALLAGREGCMQLHEERGCSYTMTGFEGPGGEGTAGLRCWLGERGSATLLTRQLHNCAASWKRGTQLAERGAATAR
jgi:hypothetical protein